MEDQSTSLKASTVESKVKWILIVSEKENYLTSSKNIADIEKIKISFVKGNNRSVSLPKSFLIIPSIEKTYMKKKFM